MIKSLVAVLSEIFDDVIGKDRFGKYPRDE